MKHPDEGQTVGDLTDLFVDMAAFLDGYRGRTLDLKITEGAIVILLLAYLEDHAGDSMAINSVGRAARQMLFESDLIDPEILTTDLAMIIKRRGLMEQKSDEEK